MNLQITTTSGDPGKPVQIIAFADPTRQQSEARRIASATDNEGA